MKATEAKWAARIASWRASGKTADAFAEEVGCAPASLRWWSSELVKRASRASSLGGVGKTTVRMARVRRTSTAPAPPPVVSLVVAIGHARIELRRGVDRELLREVFAALGAEK